jgi:leucyl-tRNA synthetase
MPQWAGSCWYYLRYLDPHNGAEFAAKDKIDYWAPVDLYVGGAEHAVLHLLYSRFWHKVLYDFGLVNTVEPFQRLINQGMILGEDNQKMSKSRGNVINPDDIIKNYGADSMRVYEMFMGPLELSKPWITAGLVGVSRFLERLWAIGNRDWGLGIGDRGSGNKGEEHADKNIQGSDSLARSNESGRNDLSANEIFSERGDIRPNEPDAESGCINPGQHSGGQRPEKPERISAIPVNSGRISNGTGNSSTDSGTTQVSDKGSIRPIADAITISRPPAFGSEKIPNPQSPVPSPQSLTKLMHRTIKKVSEDTASLNFNTAISAMMIYSNELAKLAEIPRELWEPLVIMLSAYAPHLGEELWEKLGHGESVSRCAWPAYDESFTHDDEVTVVVQVNGKIRDKFTAAAGTPKAELEKTALSLPGVLKWTEGHKIARIISVPDKLVNIVTAVM